MPALSSSLWMRLHSPARTLPGPVSMILRIPTPCIFSIVLTVAIGLWALLAGQWWILILGVVLTFANVQGLRAETATR